jgi:hypothetical protein
MNTMSISACASILFAIALMSSANEETALKAPRVEAFPRGKLTVTENLIRREILRLGGEWEAWSKPKLVGFYGSNFESTHFEMLMHLPTVEWLSIQDCAVDDFAMKCISSIDSLKRLDFVGCDINAKTLSLLQSNRELRYLQFEEKRLSDSMMDDITRLSQVESLSLINVDLTDVSDANINSIADMSSLKSCMFWSCEGMTPERLARLKAESSTIEWK